MGRGLGLFCLFLFVAATLATGFYFMLLYPGASQKIAVPTLSDQAKKKPLLQKAEPLPSHIAPLYEEPTLPHQAPPVATRARRAQKRPLTGNPLVAIVIDDMGNRQDAGRALLALDLPFTFAFLPFTPFSEELQREAKARGCDILLHLPLEPVDPKWDPGPGALSTHMDPESMKAIFQKDLRAVPTAIGINNHMGSRFTADPKSMRALLTLVRAHNLFFLDSVTASDSVAYDLAHELGVKAERRTVFLDNDQNPEKIRAQLDLLIRIAEEHGQAVGIGHPYPATVEALRRYQTQLRTRTKMVGIHRLVH